MKLPHLIAILAAAAVAVLVVGGAVFLLVTWRHSRDVAREEMDLRVQVPTAQPTHPRDEVHPIIINIDSDGQLTVDDMVIAEEELRRKLKIISRLDQNQPILLRGSSDANWQTMVAAIEIVEDSDLWNISFATQKPNPE